MSSEIDRHFARYRETGEPDALAAVFDETAPGLLLLAIHLTKDEARAEDLVQLTFLKVIEHAASYDPAKAFLPWASTILTNEARGQWRREVRGPTVVADVDALADSALTDPQQAASEAETIHAVVSAIDGLEATYRPVVRLKVVHGMKPGAIAKVLDLDPGVARTRLSRGLSQLRARLPETVAGALAITLGGRGMAQVRQVVMDRVAADWGPGAVSGEGAAPGQGAVAGEGARPGHGRSALGRRTFSWRFGGLSAVLAAIAVSAVWWGIAGTGRTSPLDTPRTASLDHGTASGGKGSPTLIRRVADGGDGVASAPGEASSWTLTGVISSGGTPLAGSMVAVELQVGCDERAVPVVSTDAKGRYEVSLDGLKRLGALGLLDASLQIHVAAPDHQPASEIVLDVGPPVWREDWRVEQDLVLTRGPVLRARVLDPRREPVTGWALGRVVSSDSRVGTEWLEVGFGVCESGETPDPAVLRLPVVGPPPYRLEVSGAEGSAFVQVPFLPAGGDLGDVVLDPMACVRGRIVTDAGVPVPFANVHVRRVDPASGIAVDASASTGPIWRDGRVVAAEARNVRTDAEGTFLAHGLRTGTYRVSLDYGHAERVARLCRTDDPPVDLTVEGQVLSVWAVDRDDQPIPGMALLYDWSGASGRRSGRNAINDVPGRFDFLVPYGSSWTFRSGHWRARADRLEHRAVAGQPRAELRLLVEPPLRSGGIELTVVDGGGAEIEEYGVDLYHRDSDHYLDTLAAPRLRGMTLPPGNYTMTVTPLQPVSEPAGAFGSVAREVIVPEGGVIKAAVSVTRCGVLDVIVGRDDVPATGRIRVERWGDGRWLGSGALLPRPNIAPLDGPDIVLRASVVLGGGAHTVRFVSPGGISVPCPVDIAPGRITRIRARLGPR